MATITVTIEGPTIGYATIRTDYDEVNTARFVAWLTAMYGTDADGNPRDLEGMANAYWNAIRTGTHGNIERWEAEQAAEQARSAVQPMATL